MAVVMMTVRVMRMAVSFQAARVVAYGHAIDEQPVIAEKKALHEAGFAADVGNQMSHSDIEALRTVAKDQGLRRRQTLIIIVIIVIISINRRRKDDNVLSGPLLDTLP